MAAMAPWPAGTACCINCPRRRTVRAAAANSIVAGGDVGGVLSQRMSGKIVGGYSSRGQNAQRRHGDGKDRRLGELGQPKLLFGSVKAKLRQVEAQRVVGFLKGLAGDGKG